MAERKHNEDRSMKDKDKRFGVPKIDRLFVRIPHELVLDQRISSSAHRLWEGVHICAWHKLPPDPDRLAELMHTTRRSVFRWLAELEEYHWMERFRSLDSEERYLLKTSVDEGRSESEHIECLRHRSRQTRWGAGRTHADSHDTSVRGRISLPLHSVLHTKHVAGVMEGLTAPGYFW
jgi:hypothetical protein